MISSTSGKIPEFTNDDQAVHDTAVEVLKEKSAVINKGVSLKELFPAITGKLPENLKKHNIYHVLRRADKSPFSRIQSGGPWRGYYLSEHAESPTPEKRDEVTTVGSGTSKLSESDLYPLIASWLKEEKGFKRVSYDYANKRGGSTWQNPDIVALNIVEEFGLSDIEIITCEVKIMESSWRQWIFEAVAHRLRADRSYFIFRTQKSIERPDPEIYLYAEKFSVGVAAIVLPDEKIKKLKEFNSLSQIEQREFLESIVEIVPAPKESIDIASKVEFLRNLGLNSKEELWMFGQK
jgi:hypothetical protein